MKRKCIDCSKSFIKKSNESSKYFTTKKYCSNPCRVKHVTGAKKTGIYKTCVICKQEFYVKRCHLSILRCCSRVCQGKWTSKNRIRENSANWKGGRIKDKGGYIYLFIPEHPNSNSLGYIFEHRIIMEKILGRILKKTEVVHHIDGNPSNNNKNNLMYFINNGQHRQFHGKTN